MALPPPGMGDLITHFSGRLSGLKPCTHFCPFCEGAWGGAHLAEVGEASSETDLSLSSSCHRADSGMHAPLS